MPTSTIEAKNSISNKIYRVRDEEMYDDFKIQEYKMKHRENSNNLKRGFKRFRP